MHFRYEIFRLIFVSSSTDMLSYWYEFHLFQIFRIWVKFLYWYIIFVIWFITFCVWANEEEEEISFLRFSCFSIFIHRSKNFEKGSDYNKTWKATEDGKVNTNGPRVVVGDPNGGMITGGYVTRWVHLDRCDIWHEMFPEFQHVQNSRFCFFFFKLREAGILPSLLFYCIISCPDKDTGRIIQTVEALDLYIVP